MRYLYGIDSGSSFDEWRGVFLAREDRRRSSLAIGNKASQSAVLEQSYEFPIENEVQDCLKSLNSIGHYVFQNRLPISLVNEILNSTKDVPMKSSRTKQRIIGLDAAKATGERRFDFDEHDIVLVPAIADLLARSVWSDITACYLGLDRVIQDQIAMWISLPSSDSEASSAAQMFHYDLDRPGFLKFFFLLTDVGSKNGPHIVVGGSNRTPNKRFREPRRYSDAEVSHEWPNSEVEISGKAGTVFVVDTKCLHKGLELEEGYRTILQFEFADSLFGAPYAKLAIPANSNLARAGALNPHCYQRFDTLKI